MDRRLSFHCTGPPGEWINDPNGLYFAEGRYRLLMQHSPKPEPGPVGWGAASSDDLLHWRWDGVAIPPDERGFAYSGCVVDGDAYLTRHDPRSMVQSQHRRDGIAGEDGPPIGPAGRNRRDPFVFRNPPTGDWRMLVAAPCDWSDWRDDPPSTLEIWRSDDRTTWSPAGVLGPWSPPGVMWEVPVLLRMDGTDVLILSMIDRRQGVAECSVRYWTGAFASTFVVDARCPRDGWPLDLGPDFYAAIVSTEQGWPLPDRHLIAWAASWLDARETARGGGSMTMPRRVALRNGRLVQRPPADADQLVEWTADTAPAFTLKIGSGRSRLTLHVDDGGAARVDRIGNAGQSWRRSFPPGTLPPTEARQLSLWTDNFLCELFIEPAGLTLTARMESSVEYLELDTQIIRLRASASER